MTIQPIQMSNSASANNLLELSRHQTESGAISEYEHALPSFIQTKGQCNNLVCLVWYTQYGVVCLVPARIQRCFGFLVETQC